MKQAYKISGLASAFVILLLLIPSLWPNDLALGASPRIAGAANAQVGEIGNASRQRLERFRGAMAVHKRNVRRLMEISGVVASGVGRAPDGEPVVRVFTERPSVRGIPEMLEGVRVRTKVSGRFYARRADTCGDDCETWDRWPLPVPIGVSVGHPEITAGTLGARVTDGTDVYILSNNHVLANINQATPGDPILQPGSYDGGLYPDDAIANLTDFEQINFCTVFWIWLFCDQPNTIDAAIAKSTRGEVGFSTPIGLEYGTPSPVLHAAYGDPNIIGDEDLDQLVGKTVKKFGRTTGLTTGKVDAIEATVNVCYDSSCTQIAQFQDQLIITPGTFSGGGDSGSLIVDSLNHPVGLLFAGSDANTIANRIDLVLNRFGVTIDDGGAVTPVVDLEVTGIDVPSNVMAEEPTTVTVTVRNLGTEAVLSASVTLQDLTEEVQVGTADVMNLPSGQSTSISFSWTPTTVGPHTLQARLELVGDGNAENNTYTKEGVNVLSPATGGPLLQLMEVQDVRTDKWTTVRLDHKYGDDMVVVCSPNYDLSALGPAIVRVRNITETSFEVGLGRPWYGTFGGEDFSANVHCMAVRQGVYTLAEDGVKMEAVKIENFNATDRARSWVGVPQVYKNPGGYSSPVVVGQVVSPDTANPPSNCPGGICDGDWSVFWSRGTKATNPPSRTALYVGRHTAQDPTPRDAETLMYIVIEAGAGTIDNRRYLAGLGADTVRGMKNRPPFNYSLSGLESASVAIVSQAGMDGGDGGWAILYGPSAVSATRLSLAIDEDWYYDSERNHTTEQVAYIVFE